MFAIVSDIHSNLEALNKALEIIASLGIEEKDILCLGDVIGYGPDPSPCVQVAKRFAWNIRGNHEDALLTGGAKFNPRAQQAIKWTMEQLSFEDKLWITDWGESKRDDERGFFYVHGSPRNPTEEYVLPERAYQKEWMRPLFDMFKKVCFTGHTHVPGVFADDFTFTHPSRIGNEFDLSKATGKVLINVGSVGQPRDEDAQGCFVTIDDDKLTWRRFTYDIEKVANRIYAIPALDNQLGDRLKVGR